MKKGHLLKSNNSKVQATVCCNGIPECSTCRNFTWYLGSTVRKFVKDIQKTMGAQVFVMVGHKNPDGKIERQKYVVHT